MLLAATPRQFPALAVHADITRWGWGLDEAAFAYCCDTDDFMLFYARLQATATVLQAGTRTIFDKTPRYLAALDTCMAKLDVPFFLVFKDPRATLHSDWQKAGRPAFDAWLDAYVPAKLGYLHALYAQYRLAASRQDGRVCLIRLEDLCLDTRRICERMYAHAGARFDPAYMALRGVRYENTRHGAISAGEPFGYLASFTEAERRRMVTGLPGLDDWFYR